MQKADIFNSTAKKDLGGGIFGGGAAVANIFAASNNLQSGGGIFGAPIGGLGAAGGLGGGVKNLFGGGGGGGDNAAGSLFGGPPKDTTADPSKSLFGGPPKDGGIFGKPAFASEKPVTSSESAKEVPDAPSSSSERAQDEVLPKFGGSSAEESGSDTAAQKSLFSAASLGKTTGTSDAGLFAPTIAKSTSPIKVIF